MPTHLASFLYISIAFTGNITASSHVVEFESEAAKIKPYSHEKYISAMLSEKTWDPTRLDLLRLSIEEKTSVIEKQNAETPYTVNSSKGWCGTPYFWDDHTIDTWKDEPLSGVQIPWNAKSISSLTHHKHEQTKYKHNQNFIYEFAYSSIAKIHKPK